MREKGIRISRFSRDLMRFQVSSVKVIDSETAKSLTSLCSFVDQDQGDMSKTTEVRGLQWNKSQPTIYRCNKDFGQLGSRDPMRVKPKNEN